MIKADVAALVERLEAGLEGVTPGPWYVEVDMVICDSRRQVCCGKGTYECCGDPDIEGDYGPVAQSGGSNARHIANCDPDTIRTLLSALQAQAAEIETAKTYLRTLLSSFVREHFPENTEWKPLPDLLGMLTQIDNASTIARDYRARAEAAEAKLREAVEVMREIADSDDIDNALDPERNKRIARTFLASMEQTNDKG